VALNDVADLYAITFDHTGGPCRRFELIGPGAGTWVVQVTDGVNPPTTLSATTFTDAHRQTLYSAELCADTTLTFTVTEGLGFGVDAVLI
jgi:hypothetical protein